MPALQLIAERVAEPVVLFLARLPRDASVLALRAERYGHRYITMPRRGFLPVVAVLWPVEKAREFLAWADENPRMPAIGEPRSDDAMAGYWKIRTKQTIRATVPSIVDHPDCVPSTIGRRASWGKDVNRCAFLLAEDAMAYDWSTLT